MKNSLKYKITFTCVLIFFSAYLSAQIISDYHISKNYNCTTCNLKSTTTYSFKTVRVNVHFILTSSGTGNFSETTDIYGNLSSENGYWLANTIINAANNYLANNLEMTQQLSYYAIPVEEINYSYKLNGVFFHRSDTYFECYSSPSLLVRNSGSAINVFIFAGYDGHGAAYYDKCWVSGISNTYYKYINSGNIWHIQNDAKLVNHEIGHTLSLDHPKRSAGGDTCIYGGVQYYDNCNDTPTYLDLINDGYTNPYEWCNGQYSNNIMDYSCVQQAFTPCQIEQVHSYIQNYFTGYLYGNFPNSLTQITSFSDNAAYIAETVEIPSGVSISIPNGKRLYIDAEEFEVNGQFEVPLGSTFEFIPYGM